MWWTIFWYLLAIAQFVSALIHKYEGESSFEAGALGMLALIFAKLSERET